MLRTYLLLLEFRIHRISVVTYEAIIFFLASILAWLLLNLPWILLSLWQLNYCHPHAQLLFLFMVAWSWFSCVLRGGRPSSFGLLLLLALVLSIKVPRAYACSLFLVRSQAFALVWGICIDRPPDLGLRLNPSYLRLWLQWIWQRSTVVDLMLVAAHVSRLLDVV